jgi:hypothetical protein
MTLGPDDTVYVAGTFAGAPIDVGGGALAQGNNTEPTPYVASFHDTGTGLTHNWSTSFPGNARVRGMSGGTSPVVTGEFYGWLKVGNAYASPFATTAA